MRTAGAEKTAEQSRAGQQAHTLDDDRECSAVRGSEVEAKWNNR